MIALEAGLGLAALACFLGLAVRFPIGATVAWMLAVEAMPEFWATFYAPHETIIAGLKTIGLMLAIILAIRHGPRLDAWNPGFGFAWIFVAGLAHGLYPGLSVTESFRSLFGSAAPFLFGFVRLPANWCRAVIRATMLAPLWSVAVGFALQLAGLHPAYDASFGVFRLTGPGEAPDLAGFALVGVYAGLVETCGTAGRFTLALVCANLLILLLTGARAPLTLALLLAIAAFFMPGAHIASRLKISILATAGAIASLAVMFLGSLGFLRVIDLAQAGQAENLSNRGLTWPFFLAAIHNSPWFGWGAGAGKVVIPITAKLSGLIGTNAAHNEYLRLGAEGGLTGLALLGVLIGLWAWRGSAGLAPAERWMVRLSFLALAVHSWTDNTLIATTACIFFIWASAVFRSAEDGSKAAA
jgi:O-antigen ligase